MPLHSIPASETRSRAMKRWGFPSDSSWARELIKAELRVEFDNVLNRMRVCGGDKMDNSPYDVAGLDPNNINFNFGIVSPGAVCQGNTPRRGQAVFKITF